MTDTGTVDSSRTNRREGSDRRGCARKTAWHRCRVLGNFGSGSCQHGLLKLAVWHGRRTSPEVRQVLTRSRGAAFRRLCSAFWQVCLTSVEWGGPDTFTTIEASGREPTSGFGGLSARCWVRGCNEFRAEGVIGSAILCLAIWKFDQCFILGGLLFGLRVKFEQA